MAFALKPQMLVMSVLFAGCLAVGYMILPGYSERVAMLERDGRNREALEILESRFETGDRSAHTLYQMQKFYEQFGDLAKLRQTLEMLVAARPRDPAIHSRLQQLYAQTQDQPAYIKALSSQIAVRYSEAACKELIGLYRRNGAHDEEKEAIATCRSKGYRRADDIARLGQLHAASGDATQAIAYLKSVDDVRRLKGDRERYQLFALQVDADQMRDALRRAVRWVKGSRSELMAITLMEMLVDRNRHDAAIELAREITVPGDSGSLMIGEIMLDKGQQLAARSFLRGWFEKASLDDVEVAARFIEASLDAEDPDNAYRGAKKIGLSRLPEELLVSMAEAFSVMNKAREFEEVRSLLQPEAIKQHPLLGAAIEESKGGPVQATRELLAKVETSELESWRLALWSRLMAKTGRPGAISAAEGRDRAAPVAATPATQSTKFLRRKKRLRRLRVRPPAAAASQSIPQPLLAPLPKLFAK